MNSISIVFIVVLLCIINLSYSYKPISWDADEQDPNMDFFDYHEMRNRKTSVVYIDVTEEPPRVVYKRRKLKKKKKKKKKNYKTLLQRTKYNEFENEKQEEIEPVPHKVKRGKRGRNAKKIKVRNNVPQETPQFKTWEGVAYKEKDQNKESSKVSETFDGHPEMRKPVDIIVHIKMKE